MATTHKISSTDLIMANLSWNGRTMASIAKSNFTSIDDVVRLITTMAGKCVGLAKLTIRNKTQGWAINMGISTVNSMSIKNLMKPILPQKGTQLSIPFQTMKSKTPFRHGIMREMSCRMFGGLIYCK